MLSPFYMWHLCRILQIDMRVLVLALVVALAAVLPPLAAPSTVVHAGDAADLLPQEADLKSVLAPLTVSKLMTGPGIDGWGANESFEIGGSADGAVLASIDTAVMPTGEGAAGLLQTKLQQLRDGASKDGLVGQLNPADANLTQDADEAYIAVYLTPDGAPNRALTAVLVSRYDSQVTSVQTLMGWDGPGTIPSSAQQAIGVTLGLLAKQVNELASSD